MTDSTIGKSKITASFVGRLAAASVLALGVGVAAPASAAPATAAGTHLTATQQKQYQAFRKIQGALIQDRNELVKIRQATFKKHPELIKQQKDYAASIMTEMTRKGYAPQKHITELRALQAKLHSGKVKGAKRQALERKFLTGLESFRKNEQKVLATPKLQAMQEKFKDAVLAAMRKENPKTDALLKDMDANRHKLSALQAAAMHRKK